MDIKLSEDHELQVQSYLRFAKLKRAQHVREALSVISEFKNDRISAGEMYNYDEIKKLLEDMSEEMKTLVDKEIQHAYHTNALLVKILLNQAQVNGLQLQVDTNALENEFLLKQIAASEVTAMSRPASDFVRRNAQLGKIGSVNINVTDAGAAKERDALGGELATTQQRLAALQEQTTQMMRDRSALNAQINELKDQLAAKDTQLAAFQQGQSEVLGKLQHDFSALSVQAAGAAQTSNAQFEDLKKQLNDTRAALETARRKVAEAEAQVAAKDQELRGNRDALDGKLMDCKQFQQMKAMMQKKSSEVTDLRKRLAKYEPQNVPSADDD